MVQILSFRIRISLLWVVFLLYHPALGSLLAQSYVQGLALYEAGKFKEATNVWLTEWNTFSSDSTYSIDPRCGIAFIKTVTEQNMSFAYKTASAFYVQSILSAKMKTYAADLKEEWKATALLATEQERDLWEGFHKNWTPEKGRQAVAFWEALDSNPETEHNESLLLFYERVALTIKNYPNVSLDDERLQAMLKYGPPIFTRDGTYVPNWATLRSSISRFLAGDELTLYLDYLRSFFLDFSLDYEIWKYQDTEMVFFKGKDQVYRESTISNVLMQKAKIPPRVLSMNVYVRPYVPAFFIIYDISHQLSTKSDTYAYNFFNVIAAYEEAFGEDGNFRAEVEKLTATENNEIAFKKLARPVENLSQNPYLEIQSAAQPYVFLRPQSGEHIVEHHISATYSVLDRSAYANLQFSPDSISLSSATLGEQSQPVSTKPLVSPSGADQYVGLLTTHLNKETSPSDILTLHTKAHVRIPRPGGQNQRYPLFLGDEKKTLKLPELTLNTNEYTFSDVVLGVGSEVPFSELYSFQPLLGDTLQQGNNLAFYLEIYPPENETNPEEVFQLSVKTQSGKFFRLFDRSADQSISLRINLSEPWNPVELEYETKDFEPGKYTLQFELSDANGKRVARTERNFVVK